MVDPNLEAARCGAEVGTAVGMVLSPPVRAGVDQLLVADLSRTTEHGSSLPLFLGSQWSGNMALAILGGTGEGPDRRDRNVGLHSDTGSTRPGRHG